MTNTEVIDACDEVYGALCKAYNDSEKENCPGCPFDGPGCTCPLGELIVRFAEADADFEKMKKARDMWKEKYEATIDELNRCEREYLRLEHFVLALDGMRFEGGSITQMIENWEIRKTVVCHSAQELLDEVGM